MSIFGDSKNKITVLICSYNLLEIYKKKTVFNLVIK